MRRLLIVSIVTLLAMTSVAGRSATAQGGIDDEAWEHVDITVPGDEAKDPLRTFLGVSSEGVSAGGGLADRLAVYDVTFQQELANVPEVDNVEFMVVIVQSAEFALDVIEETLVVDRPGPDPIVILEKSTEDTLTGPEVTYTATSGHLKNPDGVDCTSMCTVLPGTPVLLQEGDRIIAPAGHKCYYCLLHGTTGELFVYPLLRTDSDGNPIPFSWITSKNESGTATPIAMAPGQRDTASAPTASGMMAWAYFNPSSNCRGG